MNTTELVEAVAKCTRRPQYEVKAMLGAITETIEAEMSRPDGEVGIFSFGTFKSVRRAQKPARNPKTGEPVTVPARQAIKFKPSIGLLDRWF